MTEAYGRILCVDNDPKICQMMALSLEDSGFLVYESTNSEDAVKIFEESHPDLVVYDVTMPDIQGTELIDVIRRDYPQTPFIVTSFSGVMSDVIEALHKGAWDYLVKPISNSTVLEHAVCRALERRRLIVENTSYRIELENKNLQLKNSLKQLEEDQFAGKSVQQKLLPRSKTEFNGQYTFSYKILPSLYLSGDFVDYFEIEKKKIGFYIADVSGHGASSAFITILLKNIMEQYLVAFQKNEQDDVLHPNKILARISNDIYNANLGKYLTMIYGVLDINRNCLQYSVGGHYPSPLFFEGVKATFLEGEGYAVGVKADATFECYEMALPERFQLALFSDGIFEAIKGRGSDKLEQKLLSVFNEKATSVDDVLDKLSVDDGRHPDDVSLFLISRGYPIQESKSQNEAR